MRRGPPPYAALDARMTALGYDFRNTSTFGGTPAAMENRIAPSILGWGRADGSNEAGGVYGFFVCQSAAAAGGIDERGAARRGAAAGD